MFLEMKKIEAYDKIEPADNSFFDYWICRERYRIMEL